ncbi:MAG: phytoene desaturase family protein [Planctomycetales bacterium]
MPHAVVIGAGIGGLCASLRLARRGWRVTLLEGRDQAGGLAAAWTFDGWRFDAGPYILLDRPGLEWAFRQLELEVEQLALQRIEEVYESCDSGESFQMFASLEQTASLIESRWPGSGDRYRQFIQQMRVRYARLQPFQCAPPPGVRQLLQAGIWRDVPFLWRSLEKVLAAARLPAPVVDGLGVWTHVAGQVLARAPSPLALVPAVIHHVGAYYPRHGIGAIPEALERAGQALGIDLRLGTRVERIRCRGGAAQGVLLNQGEFLEADAVISDVGLGTYLQLLDDEGLRVIPRGPQRMLDALPLQSPGVCAYLAVQGAPAPPYLRFQIHPEPDGCRLLVTPGVLDPGLSRDGWFPARLIAPMHHANAQAGGESGQRDFLARVLEERWWRDKFSDVRILATRIPREWGSAYALCRDSMNPVMTPQFMRAGRLAHRSPWLRRLYLTGSGTHPGQWVSFCAVSGVLTADRVLQDRE